MSSSLAPSPSPVPSAKPTDLALQIASGHLPALALQAVIELKIPDLLATGAKSADELASLSGANPDALYRILRMLASLGLFREIGLRYFELAPAGECLRSDVPGSVRNLALWFADRFHFEVYPELAYSLRTGKPAIEHVKGKPVFDYFEATPEVLRLFQAAMTDYSAQLVPALLEAYDFSQIHTLVDIAGGHGHVLSALLRDYPQMQGVVFDLPSVIETTKQSLLSAGLADRCRAVAGDFFAAVPTGGDAYFLQHIIHDWEDDKAVAILKNVREALAGVPNGRVLIVDCVISSAPGMQQMLDIEMLVMTGGRERTAEEFSELLARAGLRLSRIVPTKAAESIVEAVVG